MSLTHENVEQLAYPFAFEEHEFLNGYVYIREDAITSRLDAVDPCWSWAIRGITVRDNMVTAHGVLTVNGVERDGIGSQVVFDKGKSEPEKGAATDALKRAARLFGIGRYLLNAPTGEPQFKKWLGTESKTDRLLREIDEERGDHLKDTEKTFTANTCVTKQYGGKTFYEFTGNGVTAGCWSLTDVGGKDVFEADEFDKLHKVGKHELVPMLVTYTGVTAKDGKVHNKVLRLALMEIAF